MWWEGGGGVGQEEAQGAGWLHPRQGQSPAHGGDGVRRGGRWSSAGVMGVSPCGVGVAVCGVRQRHSSADHTQLSDSADYTHLTVAMLAVVYLHAALRC